MCLALLGALLTWGARVLLTGPPTVCRDEVAQQSVVRVCGPLPITDTRVVLFLLVAGLLLGSRGFRLFHLALESENTRNLDLTQRRAAEAGRGNVRCARATSRRCSPAH